MMWPIFWPDDTLFTIPGQRASPCPRTQAAIGDDIAEPGRRRRRCRGHVAMTRHGYGAAVAGILFPDVLPYVVGTPARYGLAGLNGRTLRRQRSRGHALARHRHGHPVGTEAVSVRDHLRAPQFPYVVPA